LTFIVSIHLSVTPRRDVVLPPMTSKVVKSFLTVKNLNLDWEDINRRPYQITPLILNGNYMYARKGEPGTPLTLRGGVTAHCRVSFATKEVRPEFFTEMDGILETPYGEFQFGTYKFEVVELDKLRLTHHRVLMRFRTTTLLTNLYMLPPMLKGKFREVNRLVPQPSLLISSLVSIWNSVAEPKEMILLKERETTPYYLGRIADLIMMETGYNVRPETALIGKSDQGKMREARGFTGWVKYEILGSPRTRERIGRLLALANHLGVGRSRGLGFGVVEVKELQGGET